MIETTVDRVARRSPAKKSPAEAAPTNSGPSTPKRSREAQRKTANAQTTRRGNPTTRAMLLERKRTTSRAPRYSVASWRSAMPAITKTPRRRLRFGSVVSYGPSTGEIVRLLPGRRGRAPLEPAVSRDRADPANALDDLTGREYCDQDCITIATSPAELRSSDGGDRSSDRREPAPPSGLTSLRCERRGS